MTRTLPFAAHVLARLDELERAGLMRRPRVLESAAGPRIRLGGRDVLSFCSNDYLGLASHPELAQALADAALSWGVGSGASRHVSGSLPPHVAAQKELARLVEAADALLFGSGYAANVGAIQALAGPEDVVFSDALNHASLIDGCRLSRARVIVHPHGDPTALETLLRAHRSEGRAALIVTDSVFSMDGDLAPLRALRSLADRYDAGLLVDEAHALGVLGPAGGGLCREQSVVPDVLVGTLGKSFGLAGAFVAGAETLVRLIENRARSYVFSTAPPPAIAAALPRALALATDARRATVLGHARRIRAELPRRSRLRPLPGPAPIVPVVIGEPELTMRASAALLQRGVFVHGIRPPTVPAGTSRLRIVPTAAHTHEDVDRLLDALASLPELA